MRSLSLLPGVLFTLVAVAWSGTTQDAADPEPALRVHEEDAFEGYTLFSPLLSDRVFLIDMAGEVVHTWQTELAPAGSVYLLENGHLLRAGRHDDNPRFRGGGIGGRIQEFDWEGKLVWDFPLVDDYQTQHHDLEPMPNGNVLAIVWEHRYREDAIEFGRDPEAIGERGMWVNAILEIKPLPPDDGEIVWEWHCWDHLIQDRDPDLEGYGSIPECPGRIDINADHRDLPPETEKQRRQREELERQMRALGYTGGDEDEEEDGGGGGSFGPHGTLPDWLHTNSVNYSPEHDLIVLCTPNIGEVWVIDHSTTTDEAAWESDGRWGQGGAVLYRWGNPRNWGAGHDGDRRLWYQHDATWLSAETPDELRLLIFNNGSLRPGEPYSSVDELVLPFDPEKGFFREEGAAFGPEEPDWQYTDPGTFFSGFISGAQRLPNGNTLICQGADGRIFEVTPEKKIVWEYVNPYGGEVPISSIAGGAGPKAVFRATRFAPDAPELAGRDL